MDSTRIQNLFRVFGKLVRLDELGDVYASGIKAHAVASEQQHAAADDAADPYGELTLFVAPLVRTVVPVAQALDRIGMIAKSAADNFIRVVGPELGQPSNAAPATILNALKTAMQASSQTVHPSGKFFLWFRDTYGVSLPMNDPSSISDNWVTTTIV